MKINQNTVSPANEPKLSKNYKKKTIRKDTRKIKKLKKCWMVDVIPRE